MRAAYLLLLVILVGGGSAHTLYVEFPKDLSAGSSTNIWVAYGHGGTADAELLSLPLARLISPGGRESSLDLDPFQGGLRGEVRLQEAGTHIIDLQAETSFFDPSWFGTSGDKMLVEKYSRALLPVKSGTGFGWSSKDGLEIVSQTDPYLLRKGDKFQGQAFWKGVPIRGSFSAMVARLPEDVLVVQHAQETVSEGVSESGEISLDLVRPGLWVLSFEATIDQKGVWKAPRDDPKGHYLSGDELKYDQMAPTAYLTFWVGN